MIMTTVERDNQRVFPIDKVHAYRFGRWYRNKASSFPCGTEPC